MLPLVQKCIWSKTIEGRIWRDRWQTENKFGVNFEHFCVCIFCIYFQPDTRICKISNSLDQEGRLIIEGTPSLMMYRVKSCIFEWICPINAAGDQKQLSEGRQVVLAPRINLSQSVVQSFGGMNLLALVGNGINSFIWN